MSYASVTAHNAPPSGEQPKPNTNLREGGNGEGSETHPDVTSNKVHTVPAESNLSHLVTETVDVARRAEEQAREEAAQLEKQGQDATKRLSQRNKNTQQSVKEYYEKASQSVRTFWQQFSSDPRYWGSALGAVNVALLGGLGAFAFVNRGNARSWDRRLISAVTVGVVTLIGGEGYLATETARKQRARK